MVVVRGSEIRNRNGASSHGTIRRGFADRAVEHDRHGYESMTLARWLRAFATLAVIGCGGTDTTTPTLPPSPFTLNVEGRGPVDERFTAELWVSGNYAYTTTWGTRTVGSV